MLCAAHPEIEARGACAVCSKNVCDACASYELDGAIACERCGVEKEDQNSALSAGLLALIGVGYLFMLAVGVVLFKARPFIGGLAAIFAIGLGRAMQLLVKTPNVTRRMSRSVDATAPPL